MVETFKRKNYPPCKEMRDISSLVEPDHSHSLIEPHSIGKDGYSDEKTQ